MNLMTRLFRNPILQRAALLVAAMSLTACGGGGGDDSDSNDGSSDDSAVNLFTVPDGNGGQQVVIEVGGEELVIDADLLPDDVINEDGTINQDALPPGVTTTTQNDDSGVNTLADFPEDDTNGSGDGGETSDNQLAGDGDDSGDDGLDDFLEEVDGNNDVTIDPDSQVVVIKTVNTDEPDPTQQLLEQTKIGSNPEPVTATLGMIALTTTALAVTRRRRES